MLSIKPAYFIFDLLPIPQILTMLNMKPAMLSVTYYLFFPDIDYVIH